MDLFSERYIGEVKAVFFASRDYRYECERRSNAGNDRWYNFRLTNSYGFSHEAYAVVRKHVQGLRQLFTRAKELDPHCKADFTVFEQALSNRPSDSQGQHPARKAVDELLVALAVLPYRGVLLKVFEDYLTVGATANHRKTCCMFSFAGKAGNESVFELRDFSRFTISARSRRMRQSELEWARRKAGGDGIGEALATLLLRFTRGLKDPDPDKDESTDADADLRGFAVPAYDTWDHTRKRWRGGMAGWLVVLLRKQPNEIQSALAATGDGRKTREITTLCRYSWNHFISLLRTYVRRVREAHMRDLLEDYSDISILPTSIKYFERHLHQVIGWRIATGQDISSKRVQLHIPFDSPAETVARHVVRNRDTHWLKRSDGRRFPPGTRRLCKLFLEELRLIEGQRRVGEQTGKWKEATDVHKTISHEIKKIVPLFVPAQQWTRQLMTYWVSAYTITGFSEFTQANDGDRLPSALYGREDMSYGEWLSGLCRLCAEIEAVAIPGLRGLLPPSKASWAKNCKAIESLFIIRSVLRGVLPPREYPVRCLLGIAVLCTLRNCIHHMTRYEATFSANGKQRYGVIVPKVRGNTITCSLDATASDSLEWGRDLLIANPGDEQLDESRGGTEGAIRCYLEQLRKRAHIRTRYTYRHPFTPNAPNNMHISRLPSLAVTATKEKET